MSCFNHSLRSYGRLMLLALLLLSVVLLCFIITSTRSWVVYSSQSSPITLPAYHTMIAKRIVNLTNAMVEFEGWHPGGISGGQGGVPSVSYRNHNPGNLRSSIFQLGVRDGFAYFQDDFTGLFAMRFDIMRKCQGKTVTNLTGDSILADLIKVYSASEGEALGNYVKFVCERTGFSPDMKIGELIK